MIFHCTKNLSAALYALISPANLTSSGHEKGGVEIYVSTLPGFNFALSEPFLLCWRVRVDCWQIRNTIQ